MIWEKILKIMAKKNECVVITGASGKIGLNFTYRLLELGYDVVGISRNKIDVTPNEISTRKKTRGDFYCIEADLMQPKISLDIISELKKQKYNVVGLINNARNLSNLKVRENGTVARENFQAEYLLNVVVPYELSLAICENVPTLRSIINIGSIYGSVAMNSNLYSDAYNSAPIHYSVSKAALIHLTKELAMRFAAKNVLVNCISFGGVKGREPSSFMKRYAMLCPSGKMLDEEELSHHIEYMISKEFKGMTGQNVIVDGGWTVW